MRELKERNKAIRRNYKLGQGGVIGKQVGVSRQRIHQIKNKKKSGFLRRLWDSYKMMVYRNQFFEVW